MKAKELMIGDWYYDVSLCYDKDDPNDEYRKVTRVGSIEHFMYDDDSNDIYRVNRNYSHPKDWNISQEKNMKPIPLTEDILKENGFGRDKSHVEFANIIGDYVILYNTAVGRLSIDFEHINNGKGVPKSIVSIPLRYVHELQHALRLCGLNELADNFKVK